MICAGGTGGHILPGLSIYYELKKNNQKVKFICRKKDMKLIDDLKSIKGDLFFLNGIGLLRSLSFRNIVFFYYMLLNLFKTLIIFIIFSPECIICMGGYITFPVLFISRLLRRSYFICEQNSVPGVVNRIFGQRAQNVFINFSYTKKYFSHYKIVGNPLREEIKNKIDKRHAFQFFHFKEEREVLLIMGGSQGALRINYSISQIFKYLYHYNIIWLVGKAHYSSFKKYHNHRVCVLAYLKEMNYAYSIADVAISRAGATSITELAYYGIPTLFIPLSLATGNHQYRNSSILVHSQAAELLEEKDLYAENLLVKIKEVHQKRNIYKRNIKEFYREGSEQLIAHNIYQRLNKLYE